MAVSLTEADRMIAACAARGTRLALGHQRRFYPGWTEARRLIGRGTIGRPVLVTGTVIDGLLNTGSHVVDGIRYALGDPQAEWVMGALEPTTARGSTECVRRWVWGRPAGWDRGEGSGRSEGRERGVHPLFPAILSVEQEG